jgi:hypothetical protein
MRKKRIFSGSPFSLAAAAALAAALWACSSGDENNHTNPCPDSLPTLCGTECVNTQSNPSHCGACNNACPPNQLCVSGSCQCQPGLTLCGSECVNTASDSRHCGVCNNPCPSGMTCTMSTCVCSGGLTQCGNECVDVRTSMLHCGSCNHPCLAEQTCVNGSCTCPTGTELCNDECVDYTTDPRHCGSCNHPCPSGQNCSAGECTTVCDYDRYEGNNQCQFAPALSPAAEGAGTIYVSDANLYTTEGTDTDWYTVSAIEGSHLCWPIGSDQCTFWFDLSFGIPAGGTYTDYEVCVFTAGGCALFEYEYCSDPEWDWDAGLGAYVLTFPWWGQCGYDDSWTFYIKVTGPGGTADCSPYTLNYSFNYFEETCPT